MDCEKNILAEILIQYYGRKGISRTKEQESLLLWREEYII